MPNRKQGPHAPGRGESCRFDIRIESRGDVNVFNCCDKGKGGGAPEPEPRPCKPPRAEGACVPLGLGCKPKQSRRTKLEALRDRNRAGSAIAASFFQTGRRFLRGAAPANGFEASVFPIFAGLSPEARDILACAVDSFETTPPDLRDAGLDPELTADPDKPVDAAALTAAILRELTRRTAEAAFGDPDALEAERPGLNRFFDPGGEFFEAQLQICRVNDLRTASFRPPISLGERLPAEIQQHCALVLGEDGVIRQNCSVLTGTCPGNMLEDGVCARVPDVANGEAVVLSGVNFMRTDMKVRLKKVEGAAEAEVEAHVFGDLETPRTEVVDGQTRIIRDCRVKDRLSFVVPDDLPPGIYDLNLALENSTGFAFLGPVILSNTERINVLPPASARFQIVAERMSARRETSPASFGSDEVALTFMAAALLPDGTTGPVQSPPTRRFEDVDSGDDRTMDEVIFTQSAPADGAALSVIGFEVDSERAFRLQIDEFSKAFVDYVKRAWEAFRAELTGIAGGLVKLLGAVKGAIAIAIAAALAAAVIAVVARWAPADLIMDDAIGLSVVELAELTNVDAPAPGFGREESPQGLEVNVTPLQKLALTYRELREYVSEAEDSRYEVYYRYNRTA